MCAGGKVVFWWFLSWVVESGYLGANRLVFCLVRSGWDGVSSLFSKDNLLVCVIICVVVMVFLLYVFCRLLCHLSSRFGIRPGRCWISGFSCYSFSTVLVQCKVFCSALLFYLLRVFGSEASVTTCLLIVDSDPWQPTWCSSCLSRSAQSVSDPSVVRHELGIACIPASSLLPIIVFIWCYIFRLHHVKYSVPVLIERRWGRRTTSLLGFFYCQS